MYLCTVVEDIWVLHATWYQVSTVSEFEYKLTKNCCTYCFITHFHIYSLHPPHIHNGSEHPSNELVRCK